MKTFKEFSENIAEEAKSYQQYKFMRAVARCKKEGKCPSEEIEKAAEGMTMDQIDDFFKMSPQATKEMKAELKK